MPNPTINLNTDSGFSKKLRDFKLVLPITYEEQASFEENKLPDYNSAYGITDYIPDAWNAMNAKRYSGEADTALDEMLVNLRNIERSKAIKDALSIINDDNASYEDKVNAQLTANDAIESLRKDGVLTSSQRLDINLLDDIINTNSKDYAKSKEKYDSAMSDYNELMNNKDISNYFTRKANDQDAGYWDSFWFKMPGTQGSSSVSWKEQLASMAGEIAGNIGGRTVGGYIGGAIGTAFAPGAGTAAGAAIGQQIGGALGGLAGQFAPDIVGYGAAAARKQESHMEAIGAMYEKVLNDSEKAGLDLGKITNNIREQLKAKGEDPRNYTEQMLLQRAMTDPEINSGSSQFDDIAKNAFIGTRRVYEENMALGAGEVVSDLTYVVPLGSWGRAAVGKIMPKGLGKIGNFMARRAALNAVTSTFGNRLRNYTIAKGVTNFVTGSALRSVIEGSEEGAQNLIVKKYMDGEYDNDSANASMSDALSSGQMFKDILDTAWLRGKSTGMLLRGDGNAKDMEQLYEEYMGGMMLPFFSPQGALGSAFNAKSFFNKVMTSKSIGDYIAQALADKDETARNIKFFEGLRRGFGNHSNYDEVLDTAKLLLSQQDDEGNFAKNMNTGAISEDGKPLTQEDIDIFFNTQKQLSKAARDFKDGLIGKYGKTLALDPDKEDIFLGLAYKNATDVLDAQLQMAKIIEMKAVGAEQVASSKEFQDSMKAVVNGNLNAEDYGTLAILAMLNVEIESVTNRINAANLDAQARAQLEASMNGGENSTATNAADTILAMVKHRDTLLKQQKELLEDFNKNREEKLDEDTALSLDTAGLNPQDQGALLNAANQWVDMSTNILNQQALSEKYLKPTKEFAEAKVAEYLATVKRDHEVVDRQNNPEAQQQHAEEKAVSNKKVIDLTEDEIASDEEAIESNISTKVQNIKNVFDNVPEGHMLSDLANRVKRQQNVFDTDYSYARYITRVMQQSSKDLEEKMKDADEASKNMYAELKRVTDTLGDQLQRLIEIKTENLARDQEYDFKNASSIAGIYTDENGNRFSVRMSDAKFSERKGLIIKLIPEDVQDDPLILQQIKDLENLIKQLERDSNVLNDAEAKALDNIFKVLNDRKKALEDQLELKRKELIVKASDPLLEKMVSTNNEGETRTLAEALKSNINDVNEIIQSNRRKRSENLSDIEYDQDAVEPTTNNAGGHLPSIWEKKLRVDQNKGYRVKFFPLGGTFGDKQRAKLLNQYYEAKYWHGRILFAFKDAESVYDTFKKYDEKKAEKRMKAAETFIALGKSANWLRENNKLTDEFIEQLEQLYEGKIQEIKVGKKATVTRAEYKNMIDALPLAAILYQSRTGKQRTVLASADELSTTGTEKLSKEERESRVELINNLIWSYKKVKPKLTDEEKSEGFSEEGGVTADGALLVESTDEEDEQKFTNSVTIETGDAQAVYGTFDFSLKSEIKNPGLFTNDDGSEMTASERYAMYLSKASKAYDAVVARIDNLIDLLKELGWDISKDELDPKSVEKPSPIMQLIQGLLEYGDGAISVDTAFNEYLQKYLGNPNVIKTVDSNVTKTKDKYKYRTSRLLDFIMNTVPEEFISYGDPQLKLNNTPSIRNTVVEALKRHWFQSKSSIKVYKNGVKLTFKANDYQNESVVSELNSLFSKLETLLNQSRTADEFIENVKTLSPEYDFALGNAESITDAGINKDRVEKILRDYFTNRKFGRLKNSSNIAQVFTTGSSHPMNEVVNQDDFNRRTVHVQHKLTEIPSLGLIKNQDGQYEYSIDFFKTRIKKESESSENKKGATVEYDVALKQLKDQHSDILKNFPKKSSSVDEIISYIAHLKNDLNLISDAEYLELVGTQKKDSTKLKLNYARTYTLGILESKLKDAFLEQEEKLAEKYDADEEIEKFIKTSEEFKNKDHLPISFAYGSYRNSSGVVNIIHFDNDGNKHIRENETGKSGAIYLILPSFLNSARRSQAYHLNIAYHSQEMSNVIARLFLEAKNRGFDNLVGNITLSNGVKVSASTTFRNLLNNFVFFGKDAIQNSPNDNNFANLLYVDKDGSVKFTEEQIDLTEDNIDQFAEFIMKNKLNHLLRDKMTSPSATFGFDVEIKAADGSDMYSRSADDNYIASVIENGLVTADLNTSEKSHIFDNPGLLVSYKKHRTYKTINNDPNSEGSAENAKTKLKQESYDAMRPQDLESEAVSNKEAQTAEKLQSYIKKWLLSYFDDLKFQEDGKKYELRILSSNNASEVVGDTYIINTIRIVNDEGTKILAAFENGDKHSNFIVRIINRAKKGYKSHIVLVDDSGKIVKNSDKWLELKYKESGEELKLSSTEPNDSNSALYKLIEQLATQNVLILQQLNALMGTPGPLNVAGNQMAARTIAPSVAAPLASSSEVRDIEFKIDDNVTITISADDILNKDDVDTIINDALDAQLPGEYDDYDSQSPALAKLVEQVKSALDLKNKNAQQSTAATPVSQQAAAVATSNPQTLLKTVSQNNTTNQSENVDPNSVDYKLNIVLTAINYINNSKLSEIITLREALIKAISNQDSLGFDPETIAKSLTNQLLKNSAISEAELEYLPTSLVRYYTNTGKVNQTSIFLFLDQHVEKEDADTALENVYRILGKDVKITFETKNKTTYDKSRGAVVYVLGQVGINGITLLRNAITNQVAKGTAYHEAFHRVSLFVLSTDQRKQMYELYRKQNPEYANKTNLEVEEALADEFKMFVLNKNALKGGKFYSSNKFFKFFLKMYDAIKSTLQKLKINLFGTPNFKSIDKLFSDMYAGRYAYAKVTKDNIEEFLKVYDSQEVYEGVIVNGVKIANTAKEYDAVFRDLLGRFVRLGELNMSTNGHINVDLNNMYNVLVGDRILYKNSLDALQRKRNHTVEELLQMSRLQRLVNTLNNIIGDSLDTEKKVWLVWQSHLKQFIENKFNMDFEKINKADSITDLPAEPSEKTGPDVEQPSDENEVGLNENDFSHFTKPAWLVNQFNALHASMKAFLWAIPLDGKLTPYGLQKYADPAQLYTKIVHTVTGAYTRSQMFKMLETAAENDEEIKAVYGILKKENTTEEFKNRFFSSFVLSTANFSQHDYQPSEEGYYDASIKNANSDVYKNRLINIWKSNFKTFLSSMSDAEYVRTNFIIPTIALINKSMVNDVDSIVKVLEAFRNTGFFNVLALSDNVQEDAKRYQAYIRKSGLTSKEFFTKLIAHINNTVKKSNFTNERTTKNSSKKLENIYFGEKGLFTELAQNFDTVPTAKTNMVAGPQGVKIFSINKFNYITKMFNNVFKLDEFRDGESWAGKLSKNAYSQNSKWLKHMHNTQTKLVLKLMSSVNNDIRNSVEDHVISESDDLLNKFVSILNQKHTIPSLANKKFAADLEGFDIWDYNLIDSAINIGGTIIDRFVGYIADEVLAISDAIYAKKEFIKRINTALGTDFTIDNFSELSSEEQEDIFLNKLSAEESKRILKLLRVQYHFKAGKSSLYIDETAPRSYIRQFHIDLRKGTGDKSRHFASIIKNLKLTDSDIEEISKHSLDGSDRTDSNEYVHRLLGERSNLNGRGIDVLVKEMLRANIQETYDKFKSLGIIKEENSRYINKLLPVNTLKLMWGKEGYSDENVAIRRALSYFTLVSMSDSLEFEKLIAGDKGFHKDITAVNKRYSGINSTIALTSEKSTHLSDFGEDELYDSKTYNVVTMNTSTVINTKHYRGLMTRMFGIDPVASFESKDGKIVVNTIDAGKFLDAEGNLTDTSKRAPMIRRFMQHRDAARGNAKNMTDRQLVEAAIEEAKTHFAGYLKIDPTDGSSYISASLFRQVRQREGSWTDVTEAAHNMMELYEEFPALMKQDEYKPAIQKMLNLLGINYDDFKKEVDKFASNPVDKKIRQHYVSYIISATEGKLDATSLKYVYYGDASGREDQLYVPIYDKFSMSPIYKIFTENFMSSDAISNQMREFYDFMKDNKIHMLKMESATKSGGVPSFEAFDAEGKFNKKALEHSVVQPQYFDNLGKQLNTDPHEATTSSLLTQFMKIAQTNVVDDNDYIVGTQTLKGHQVRKLYKDILDYFTAKGLEEFRKEWGVDDNGVQDKSKLVNKLRKMAETQGLSAEVIDSLRLDEAGNFKLHPAALPNMNWIESRIISEMNKKVIETITPGQPLYQVASIGYDNMFDLQTHSDVHLRMPGEQGSRRMEVKLSINMFKDVIEMAKNNKEAKAKYNGLKTFEDQRRFILDNKKLFALSYRVPTQGLDSTIPIEIVDLFPPQRGAIISFPTGITAMTGADKISMFAR